jgi:antitoxin component YwqK of YwqJK toxin-antitoxin module
LPEKFVLRVVLFAICLCYFSVSFSQPDSSSQFIIINTDNQATSNCKKGVFDTLIDIHTPAKYKARHVIIWNNQDTQILRTFNVVASVSSLEKVYYRSDFLTDSSSSYGFTEFYHFRNYKTGAVSLTQTNVRANPKAAYQEYLNFKDGYLEGDYALYYPNGMPAVIGFYHENIRSGVWQFFHDNGTLLTKGYYDDWVMTFIEKNDDHIRIYGRKNEILETVTKEKALKHIEAYYNSSNPEGIPGVYFFRIGKWTVFDKEGNPIRKQKYRRGKLIKDKIIH